MSETRAKRAEMERHVQTVALALITAGLLWVGSTLRSMYDNQIKQAEALVTVQRDVTELSGQVKDVRAQMSGLPTQREVDARFNALERRVDVLEGRR